MPKMSLLAGFGVFILRNNFRIDMREETERKIVENLRLPDEQRHPLTIPQQNLMDKVSVCLGLLNENLLMPVPKLRDAVVEACQCTPQHAYTVIRIAFEAIGNRTPTAKNVVREGILQMAREMHEEAMKLDGVEKINALAQAGNMLARAFATSSDDGELLNVAELVRQADIKVTVDVAALGIETTERDRTELRRMMKEDGIEDAEVV